MEDTNIRIPDTEGTNMLIPDTAPAPKPKRTRNRTKAAAPVKAPTPPPTRTLDELQGEDFEDMTKEELLLVVTEMSNGLQQAQTMMLKKDQELRESGQQLRKYQAYAGYVRETIDHARNSLLLQANALGAMSGNARDGGF